MAIKRERPKLMKMPDVLRLVAKELDISTLTARRMVQRGQLPAPAIAANQKSRWWRREDIEAWLAGDQGA